MRLRSPAFAGGVSDAVKAVNSITTGFSSSVAELSSLDKDLDKLVRESKAMPTKLKGEFDGNFIEQIFKLPKTSKTLTSNIKITSGLPNRSAGVVNEMGSILGTVHKEFKPTPRGRSPVVGKRGKPGTPGGRSPPSQGPAPQPPRPPHPREPRGSGLTTSRANRTPRWAVRSRSPRPRASRALDGRWQPASRPSGRGEVTREACARYCGARRSPHATRRLCRCHAPVVSTRRRQGAVC